MERIALQLWSVNSEAARDFPGTLEKIAKMGYTGVEFAGYGGLSAKEMKTLLERLCLEPVGTHENFDRLHNHLDEVLEYNKTLGTKYIICPSAGIHTYDAAIKYAQLFAPIAEKVTDAGFIFGYHNHSHEFFVDNGEYPMEVFLKNTDPEKIIMEFDVFWLLNANIDPLSFLEKYKNRIPVVHLKQMDSTAEKRNVNAGDGCIDFRKILQQASHLGIQDFVYEQEGCADPMDCVAKSAEFLLKL